jgi:multiple sugar transport system permease protein
LELPVTTSASEARSLKTRRRQRKEPQWVNGAEARAGIGFVLPVLVVFALLRVVPAFLALFFSFTNYSLISNPSWAGFSNYLELFKDPLVLNSFKVTLIYTVGTVVPSVVISLAVAMRLDKKIKGMPLFRTAFFTPQVASWVAISMIWVYMLNPGFGVVNYILGFVGVDQIPWLSSTKWALPSLIMIGIWRNLGYGVIIYLAGLQGVPQHLKEAAMVDGASAWRRFRKITLPMLAPTTTFLLIMMAIISLQTFDQVFVLTGGGPANSTSTVVFYVYQNAFQYLRMGYASALAIVLFVVILILSYASLRFSGQLRATDKV